MYSQTYGEVSFEQMYQILKRYTSQDKNAVYHIMIGADSQNYQYTKVPIAIGVHRIVNQVGRGGIFFSEILKVRKINNIKHKIMFETNLSLNYAQRLQEKFEGDGIIHKISIHVDAGFNGPSSQLIEEITNWVCSCGFDCAVKPHSFMASCVANRLSK